MLDISFSVDEVFEIAEQIERNGIAFYNKAAENVSNAETEKMFLMLAGQEKKHVADFHCMRKEVVSDEDSISVFDKDEVIAVYLRALAARDVFNKEQKPEDVLTGQETAEEIIRFAIEKEWDSILFYTALRDLVESAEDRTAVESIIMEEYKHVELLDSLL